MKAGERNLMVIFLVIAGGAAVLSLSFQLPEARLFPLITGLATFVLIVGYFVVMRIPKLRERLAPFLEDDIFMKISVAADALEEEEAEEAARVSHRGFGGNDRLRRELRIFAYLGGLGVLSVLVGLTFSIPIFLFSIVAGYTKESWRRALIVTVATSAFVYFVFVEFLQLPLHLGMLERLL